MTVGGVGVVVHNGLINHRNVLLPSLTVVNTPRKIRHNTPKEQRYKITSGEICCAYSNNWTVASDG